MNTRSLILASCLMLTALYLSHAKTAEAVPAHEPVSKLSLDFDGWQGVNGTAFSPEILAVLGVDSYVTRVYRRPNESAVGLYIGYYETQRQGDSIHSPLNCLPGAGWTPVSQSRTSIAVTDPVTKGPRSLLVNRYVIEKGLDRQLVVYWYQSHGRVVASEYWGKIYTVIDAVRLNRTDAALVRVMTPLGDWPGGAEPQAEARIVSFVQALFPRLSPYVPE